MVAMHTHRYGILKRRKILKVLGYSVIYICFSFKTILAATKKIINQNLSSQQKDIMFNQGTERAYTSSLLNEKRISKPTKKIKK